MIFFHNSPSKHTQYNSHSNLLAFMLSGMFWTEYYHPRFLFIATEIKGEIDDDDKMVIVVWKSGEKEAS